MHIQKIHYGKLLILLSVCLVVVYVLLNFINHEDGELINLEKIEIEIDEKSVGQSSEEIRSSSESISWSLVDSCPACLGVELCPELEQGFITVGVFPKGIYGSSRLQEFTGFLKDDTKLSVLTPDQSVWESWDEIICKNSSQMPGCPVGPGLKSSSFLPSHSISPHLLRTVGLQLGQSPNPFTACSTPKLIEEMKRIFDDNKDGELTKEESGALLTTVVTSPGLAMLRLAQQLNFPFVNRHIGSCGRVSFVSGDLVPLVNFLDSEWSVRADLASQILSMIGGGLMSPGADWILVSWDLNWSSFGVTQSGQVILTDLSGLTPIERALVSPLGDEPRGACNSKCFSEFKSSVLQATPAGQPGIGCRDALLYGDYMFHDICRNIFMKNSNNNGLLHSGGEEMDRLLIDCVEEEGRGERWRAVDDLLDFLDESEGSTQDSSGGSEDNESHQGEDYYGDDSPLKLGVQRQMGTDTDNPDGPPTGEGIAAAGHYEVNQYGSMEESRELEDLAKVDAASVVGGERPEEGGEEED